MQDGARGEPQLEQRPAFGPVIFVIGIIATNAFMVFSSLSFTRAAARLAPLLFASATVILAAVVLLAEFSDLRAVRLGRRAVASESRPVTDDAFLGAADARLTPKELTAFGWVLFAFACFYLLGFIAGMILFMIVTMRVYGKESWSSTLGVTAGVMLTVHTMFVRILGVRVFPGRFGDLIPFL